MTEKLKTFFCGPVIYHPVLFAVFPLVFLYAHNIKETSPLEILAPLAISVIATVFIWIIFSLVLKNLSKAALVTSIFVLLFFLYGRLYQGLEILGIFVPKHAHLLPISLFIFGYCVYFVYCAKRDFRTTSTVLNIAAAILVLINIANIAVYQFTKPDKNSTNATSMTGSISTKVDLPDIYFIILDEYASPDTMKNWYDYDNRNFINRLKEKGFFIATQSKSRTPTTQQAIAQILNMEYLSGGMNWDPETGKFVEIDPGHPEPPAEELYQKISSNKVVDLLKSLGYSYVHFGSLFEIDRYDKNIKDKADGYYNYYQADSGSMITEFGNILWNTTMLKPFYHFIAGEEYETFQRGAVLKTLDQIVNIVENDSPKIVFVHFNSPHIPYLFGPDGEFVSPANYANNINKEFYRDQYIFISSEIEKVINNLLNKSSKPPVIILQSDHGLRPHHSGIVIGGDEWKKILNALYLPGMDISKLPDNLSPVNTFRLIFDHYFGMAYELLEND